MLAVLRTKSQITIPKEIIKELGLEEGDQLEITSKDGMICIMPVTVYSKKYISQLRREIDEVKADIASGRQPVFTSLDSMFDKLEESDDVSNHFHGQISKALRRFDGN